MRPPPGVILLIPSAREFDRGLRRGIVEYANTHGPWIFYEEPPGYLASLTPRQRLRSMRQWEARGMIVVQSRLQDVRRLGLPAVVAVETLALARDLVQIAGANQETGRMGAEAFLRLGLRSFAFCGLPGLEFSDNRCRGFVAALRERGCDVHVYSPRGTDQARSWYTEQKQLGRWLTALPKPIGLLACNDDRARLICNVCRAQGIRVPDDMAILGVDNDEQVCGSSNPPLSSIALATERAGYEAAAVLARMMTGARPHTTIRVAPLHVVPRQSTDIFAVGDPALIRALRLARDSSHCGIDVEALAAAAGLSRRALQDRFHRHLGCSPMEEIHRCRVDRIARLLLETSLSVDEIARTAGFPNGAHLARFFARRTGVTPLAYRKRGGV